MNIRYKRGKYELPHELPNDLRLRKKSRKKKKKKKIIRKQKTNKKKKKKKKKKKIIRKISKIHKTTS